MFGSLTKMGVKYFLLWSEDFTDQWSRAGLRTWLETGEITHDPGHVRDLPALLDDPETALGAAWPAKLPRDER